MHFPSLHVKLDSSVRNPVDVQWWIQPSRVRPQNPATKQLIWNLSFAGDETLLLFHFSISACGELVGNAVHGRVGWFEIQARRATRVSWLSGENQAFPPSPYIQAQLRQPLPVWQQPTVNNLKISFQKTIKMLFFGFLLVSSTLALPLDVESTNATKSGNLKVIDIVYFQPEGDRYCIFPSEKKHNKSLRRPLPWSTVDASAPPSHSQTLPVLSR